MSTTARHFVLRSVLALVASSLFGACATTRYHGSRIETLPPGVEGKAGGTTSLELDGLKLRITGLDVTTDAEERPHLAFEIRFDAQELGYSFDPAQVVVRARDGRQWRARADAGYQPILPGSRFRLSFDVAVEPASRLDLEIAGLARGRQRMGPVTLPIARHTWSSIERVYWLEVLLAPLTLAGAGM